MLKRKNIETEKKIQHEQDIEINGCISWMQNDYPKKLIPEKDPIKELIVGATIMTVLTAIVAGCVGGFVVSDIIPFNGKIVGVSVSVMAIIYYFLEFTSDYFNYFVLLHQPKKIAWDSKYLYLWTRQDHIILLPWDRLVRLRNNGDRWSLFISRPKAIFSKEFFIGLTHDVGLKLKEYIEKNQMQVKLDG